MLSLAHTHGDGDEAPPFEERSIRELVHISENDHTD